MDNYQRTQVSLLARIIGCGLLGFAFLDTLQLLVPFRFFIPSWGFRTFGALVERTPIPLVGYLLVFAWGNLGRTRIETKLLGFLSWLALGISIFFFLALPFGISSAYRLQEQNRVQMTVQIDQQTVQFQDLKERVNRASESELTVLAKRFQLQKDANANLKPMSREQLLAEIRRSQDLASTQVKQAYQATLKSLVKTIVKWSFQAGLTICLFFCVWLTTDWARIPEFLVVEHVEDPPDNP